MDVSYLQYPNVFDKFLNQVIPAHSIVNSIISVASSVIGRYLIWCVIIPQPRWDYPGTRVSWLWGSENRSIGELWLLAQLFKTVTVTLTMYYPQRIILLLYTEKSIQNLLLARCNNLYSLTTIVWLFVVLIRRGTVCVEARTSGANKGLTLPSAVTHWNQRKLLKYKKSLSIIILWIDDIFGESSDGAAQSNQQSINLSSINIKLILIN